MKLNTKKTPRILSCLRGCVAMYVAGIVLGWVLTLAASEGAEERRALEQLVAIARDGRLAPIIRASAVWQLGSYSDASARSALIAAAKADHPAIRLVAVSMLGQAPHFRDELAVKHAASATLFAALEDSQQAVRIAALLSLIDLRGWDYDPENGRRITRVGRELAAWASVNEDDAALHRALGVVYLLTGESHLAARALEISLQLDPAGASSRYLLGVARLGQRRAADAGELFEQVPRSDPYYQNAREQLKMIP